jgi:hypothetical protein
MHSHTRNDRLPANIRQIKATLHTRGQNTDLRYSQHFFRPHLESAGETEPSYTLTLPTPTQHHMHPFHATRVEHCHTGLFHECKSISVYILSGPKLIDNNFFSLMIQCCGGLVCSYFRENVCLHLHSEVPIKHWQTSTPWCHCPKMEPQILTNSHVCRFMYYDSEDEVFRIEVYFLFNRTVHGIRVSGKFKQTATQ